MSRLSPKRDWGPRRVNPLEDFRGEKLTTTATILRQQQKRPLRRLGNDTKLAYEVRRKHGIERHGAQHDPLGTVPLGAQAVLVDRRAKYTKSVIEFGRYSLKRGPKMGLYGVRSSPEGVNSL